MLHGANSRPLSRHIAGTGTSQQSGVISWTDLMNNVVSGAGAVLSRLSQAGVDPFTTIVGQVVCQEFRLGSEGHDLLVRIIDGLIYKSAIGNVMHYGFGLDSIVRNLSATYEGGILVLLCAATSECYSEKHAAKIIWELMQLYQPETRNDYIPSVFQWLALVRQCNGMLARDEFPLMAERLMSMHPIKGLNVGLDFFGQVYIANKERRISSAASVASTILALGHVSLGRLERMTVTGGVDAGWLAALAIRFFNLRVSIHGEDAQVLYNNCGPDEVHQIDVIFASSDKPQHHLEVKSKLFVLQEFRTFFVNGPEVLYELSLLCGRVPWDRVLSLTFGRGFDVLISTTCFGEAMGTAAYILEMMAGLPTFKGRTECKYENVRNYFDFGSGQGFLTCAVMRFPELESQRTAMQSIGRKPLSVLEASYEDYMTQIQAACNCDLCTKRSYIDLLVKGSCSVIVMEAIIHLVKTLSGTTVTLDLSPNRAGIEWFYWQQVRFHERFASREHGRSPFIIDVLNITKSHEPRSEIAVGRLMDAARVFTDRHHPTKDSDYDWSALSVAGLCIFLDILACVPDGTDAFGQVSVIPGRIEMAGHNYDIVEDVSDSMDSGWEFRGREGGSEPQQSFRSDYTTLSIAARPTIDRLQVGFLVKCTGKASVLLGPSMLTASLLDALQLVRCSHHGQSQPLMPNLRDGDHIQLDMERPHPIEVFKANFLSKLVAIEQRLDHPCVWRRDECRDCCVRAADPKRKTLILV